MIEDVGFVGKGAGFTFILYGSLATEEEAVL